MATGSADYWTRCSRAGLDPQCVTVGQSESQALRQEVDQVLYTGYSPRNRPHVVLNRRMLSTLFFPQPSGGVTGHFMNRSLSRYSILLPVRIMHILNVFGQLIVTP
ncbi:hypothetical protein RRG08_034151 [Elysia crispata]|uniref:Uncharacterized protein n=1 Tax=Elysia crispata TaxID=231223 RepID=A0AAE1DIL2_9GAST|nr:hypothetical protein RRG08_034151 [Elysia crispata]